VMFDALHTYLPDWDFVAHTFLCGLGGELLEMRKEVRAVLGFSWGFSKRGSEIDFTAPAILGPDHWNDHLDYLRPNFDAVSFAPGYFQQAVP